VELWNLKLSHEVHALALYLGGMLQLWCLNALYLPKIPCRSTIDPRCAPAMAPCLVDQHIVAQWSASRVFDQSRAARAKGGAGKRRIKSRER
jgi:hypothetical protein